MKWMMLGLGCLLAAGVHAQAAKGDARAEAKAKEDVAAHRAIAVAHEKAAKCLESGKPEKECHAHLATDCKAVAIGRYCGMKHRH